MSANVLNERSVVLRLEFSIADAVRHRGVLRVIGAAIRAWWSLRSASHAMVPPGLRQDVGLPEEDEIVYWTDVGQHLFRLQPPDRSSP